MLSITTLDPELQRRMEPYAAPPASASPRSSGLAAAGVPVGVMVAPVIPGLTDHESPKILERRPPAGASSAGRVVLRLPHASPSCSEPGFALHYPERHDKVMSRIRAIRAAATYDSRFGVRQRGTGLWADEMAALFDLARAAPASPSEARRSPRRTSAAPRSPGTSSTLL